MFQSELSVYFDGQDDGLPRVPMRRVKQPPPPVPVAERKVIQLRDYQQAATDSVLREIEFLRSSMIVLATGLGKTILFCKLVEQWPGRVLVLAHLEELLQNARDDLRAITGEAIGTERGKEHHEGERIVVGLIQSVSKRLKHFKPDHFSLIIIDEAHHAAADNYRRVLEHFAAAKVVGLTATDSRADGEPLPFESCAYRMGIGEGVDEGYLVPVRGRRVIIENLDLTRVKRTGDGTGDFDDKALDDAMVQGAVAIADVLVKDYPFEKGILFFPGRASARFACELLNERVPGCALYLDGEIIGEERRRLVNALKAGEYQWLCNVGIATEGFNWPQASIVGMCSPTLSRPAYVQRAGRGTRPLAGLLNGLETSGLRKAAIAGSNKPSMLILDFVGVSAHLDLINADNFLEEPPAPLEPKEEDGEREEPSLDDLLSELDEGSIIDRSDLNLQGLAKSIKSKTTHTNEEFNPFEATGDDDLPGVELRNTEVGKEPGISHKQLSQLRKYGISDESLTRAEAQKLIGFVASHGWRLWAPQLGILKKLHADIREARLTGFE